MPYVSLPAGARIDNGVLYLPVTPDSFTGRLVQVRLRALGSNAPGPPVTLTMPVPTDEGTGVSLNNVVAGEPLTYFTAVAIIDSVAYRFDATNPAHAYAFSGFSVAATPTGGTCQLKSLGVILVPPGVKLRADQRYVAGPPGGLSVSPPTGATFSRVIGFALSDTELRIVNLPPVFLV